MRKPKLPPVKVLPKITKFTTDTISKYTKSNEKTLIEKLFYYPNFGVGFKVFMKRRPQDYWMVDNVRVKNNRHGKLFGTFWPNGVLSAQKVTQIRRTLQEGRWEYEIPKGVFHTDNGVKYDIEKIEKLIEEKTAMLAKRNQSIGYTPYPIVKKEEKKKAKMELLAKKKK